LKRKNNFADNSLQIKRKMKPTRRYLIVLIATCCWLACSTDGEIQPMPEGKRYFPLAIGNYFVHNVTQTIYTSGPIGTTTNLQRKWVVVDVYNATQNTEGFILYEYTRPNSTANWVYQKTRNALLANGYLLLSDENISFKKLVFPLTKGTSWNVNTFNTLEEKTISITALNAQRTVIDTLFTQVAEIEYTNEADRIIGNDIEKEWYAPDAGLIERYKEKITYCSNTQACLGQQIIQSGSIVSEKLIEFGNEQ
jgi:hypothetical protein